MTPCGEIAKVNSNPTAGSPELVVLDSLISSPLVHYSEN